MAGFTASQKEDSKWFQAKLPELLLDPSLKWKYVVIHDKAITSVHDDCGGAYETIRKTYRPGEYILQQIARPGNEGFQMFMAAEREAIVRKREQDMAVHTYIENTVDPSHHGLQEFGFHLPVIIRQSGSSKSECSRLLFGLIDTGSSHTILADRIVSELGLISDAPGELTTADGKMKSPMYRVDIEFPGSKLSPFHDLRVGSRVLSYNLGRPMLDPRNFGLLIGRDVMSKWNIVWNGPTSTVIISD